jgi:hypothetical protein
MSDEKTELKGLDDGVDEKNLKLVSQEGKIINI